jgi:hypothetical protein
MKAENINQVEKIIEAIRIIQKFSNDIPSGNDNTSKLALYDDKNEGVIEKPFLDLYIGEFIRRIERMVESECAVLISDLYNKLSEL